MNKASETNHDLLERLRETVEKPSEPQTMETTKTAPMSPNKCLSF